MLAGGRTVEAINALDEAASALWEQAPLVFRRAIFVQQPARALAPTASAPNNSFAAGEPLLVYGEPIGFGWKKLTDELFRPT